MTIGLRYLDNNKLIINKGDEETVGQRMAREMKYINEKTLEKLTEKLHKTGDITEEEAEKIIKPILFRSGILCPGSSSYNRSLSYAYARWYEEVSNKLPSSGNFVKSIPVDTRKVLHDIQVAINSCLSKLPYWDSAVEMEYFSDTNITYNSLSYAGELRAFKEFEKISKMSVVFDDLNVCLSYLYSDCAWADKDIMHKLAVLSSASVMKIPVVYLKRYDDRRSAGTGMWLMLPEDIETIRPVIEMSRDDVLRIISPHFSDTDMEHIRNHKERFVSYSFFDIGKMFAGYCLKCKLNQERERVSQEDEWLILER